MALNFNATTPAAPAGSSNVTWQVDASGNVSAYVASTSGSSPVDSTPSADVAAATLLAVTTPGLYRITAYLIVKTPDGASSTLPSLTITWTDNDNGVNQTFTLTPTNNGNTTATFQQAMMEVSSSAANIQYFTSGYASGTPGAMVYGLHIRIEAM